MRGGECGDVLAVGGVLPLLTRVAMGTSLSSGTPFVAENRRASFSSPVPTSLGIELEAAFVDAHSARSRR